MEKQLYTTDLSLIIPLNPSYTNLQSKYSSLITRPWTNCRSLWTHVSFERKNLIEISRFISHKRAPNDTRNKANICFVGFQMKLNVKSGSKYVQIIYNLTSLLWKVKAPNFVGNSLVCLLKIGSKESLMVNKSFWY